ncbi:helix-turn-helix domain-containing protein [Enterococcus hulanensis]|uniref:helix-turn-helix domain-containing protein n=1 Tax=Enterococcus hulanensis TaxID=2559929 RepID=UPI0020179720|nr:helix-turn-helix domain-containing protein [Enterococcus hulanensis]
MLDSLLAKEEWRKYQLLKRLERSPYFSLTKKEMMDQLEISNFVLKSMIDQLVLDLEKYGLAQEIHVFLEDPFIQLEITGTASSETLLEKYVEESISFQLLLSAVLGTFRSLNEFSEKALISYPLARSNYKQLNKYLAAFNFKIDKKFRLIGDCEKNLRLFLTELFSRIYKTDFSIFNQTDKSFVEGRQVYLLMTGMTVHQKINLQQYLYITDLRIQQQKYVEDQEKSCLLRENIQEEAENSFFRRVPEGFREAEVIAFLRYYYSRSEDLAIGLKLTENEQIIDWSQKLLAGLLHHFPNLTGYSEHKNVFLRRSCLLHFQLMETS